MLIDGVPSDASSYGQPGFIPSLDAVREFKVQTFPLSAEFGRTGGGVVNISTPGGTNQFHGSLFYFHRNDLVAARNFFPHFAAEVDPQSAGRYFRRPHHQEPHVFLRPVRGVPATLRDAGVPEPAHSRATRGRFLQLPRCPGPLPPHLRIFYIQPAWSGGSYDRTASTGFYAQQILTIPSARICHTMRSRMRVSLVTVKSQFCRPGRFVGHHG